jgi:plastocyanin
VSRTPLAAALVVLALAVPACRLSSRTDADSVGDRERAVQKAKNNPSATPTAQPPVPGAPTVTVHASSDVAKFDPAKVTAKAGPLNIHFVTPGAHNFSISGPGVPQAILFGTDQGAPANETKSLTVAAGTYTYVCTIHKATMTGKLVVT